MSDVDKEPLRLELEIHGHTFRLRAAAEEHERLQRAARHVDGVLDELTASQPTSDTTRLGIQAAFLIALDYIKLMDDADARNGITDATKKRVDEMVQRLEESLKSL